DVRGFAGKPTLMDESPGEFSGVEASNSAGLRRACGADQRNGRRAAVNHFSPCGHENSPHRGWFREVARPVGGSPATMRSLFAGRCGLPAASPAGFAGSSSDRPIDFAEGRLADHSVPDGFLSEASDLAVEVEPEL